jgi:hypothetical protein
MRIAHSSPTGSVGWRLVLVVAVALAVAACSSGGAAPTLTVPTSNGLPAISAGPDATTAPTDATGGTTGAIDPCQRLTKADVQPFFSVPVVTQLPSPVPGTCEWSANDTPGGVSTAMDVGVLTGQDALDSWSLADGPGTKTMFSGVGDQAEHYPGSTDFVSIKGDVLCKITTVGASHLAGKMNYDPTAIPDAAATQIAQSYGTLCNRIYGSGPTAPAITAPPVSAGAISSAIPTPKASVPAVGGTLGKAFPLPVGLDCTGHTTTDSEGAITCDAMMTGDQFAVYAFYVVTLPADGYQINHQQEETTPQGKEAASILFQGNEAGGLSTISIIGTDVTITLQAP